MSLLSLDILEGKTSKYETNHIHMIVDGDISFPVTNMNDKQYGTFYTLPTTFYYNVWSENMYNV